MVQYDGEVIGKNLKRLREARGLTIEEVCETVGYSSVQALYRIEKGGFPKADNLLALLTLYNTYDIRELFLEDEQSTHPKSTCGHSFYSDYLLNGGIVLTGFKEDSGKRQMQRLLCYFMHLKSRIK